MTRVGRLVVGASLFWLAGCAALTPSDRPAQRAAAFDLLGRVAVTFDGRNFSSGLRWEHAADREVVWLNTPTGQTVAHILAHHSVSKVTSADRRTNRASDVEAPTRRA